MPQILTYSPHDKISGEFSSCPRAAAEKFQIFHQSPQTLNLTINLKFRKI